MKHDDRRGPDGRGRTDAYGGRGFERARPGREGGQNPPRPARKTYDIPPAVRAGEAAPPLRPGAPRPLPDKGRGGEHPARRPDAADLSRPQDAFAGPDDPALAAGRGAPSRPDAFLPRAGSPPRGGGFPPPASEPPENLLAGRNPIREALKSGAPLEKLLVASGDLSGSAREIARMAREAGVVVQTVERHRLDQIYPAHQGMLAFRSARAYATIEEILARARERGEEPLVVVLDQVTDPHNLGAIIRSCECAGAHGVVIPERRAAGLTPACEKAAAGAINHLPVARVKNLNRALEELKRAGLWAVAAALEGEDALTADLSGPMALVIGSEGEGISRLTLSLCDRRVCLPVLGKIESLNASVAAGVMLYQVVRARRSGK